MPPESNSNSGTQPPQPKIQTEATQLLGQIPFGAIIGAPLAAAVSAQAAAAQACVDFITKVGIDGDGTVKSTRFKFGKSIPPTPDAQAKALALLNPAATATDALTDDQKRQLPAALAKVCSAETFVEVPLLTLMPIPFIRIDNMTISMKT